MIANRVVAPMARLQLSYITAGGANTVSITIPSDVVAGDILIFHCTANNSSGSNPSAVSPAGLTSIFDNASVSLWRAQGFYKIATSSDASSSITLMSGTAGQQNRVYVFRTKASPVVTLASVAGTLSTGSIANQTITSSSSTGGTLVMGYGVNSNGYAVSLSSEDGVVGPLAYRTVYKIYQRYQAPSDITASKVSPPAGQINGLFSYYLQVKDS